MNQPVFALRGVTRRSGTLVSGIVLLLAFGASGTLAAGPGKGTDVLARMRPGDSIGMLGPLGRGFEVDPRSRHLLLIAGGLGMAGVRALADRHAMGLVERDEIGRRRTDAAQERRPVVVEVP